MGKLDWNWKSGMTTNKIMKLLLLIKISQNVEIYFNGKYNPNWIQEM